MVHTYSDVGEQAIGLTGVIISQATVFVMMAGAGIIYLVLLGDLMHGIVDVVPRGFWTLAFGLALTPLVIIMRTFGEVSWTSYLASGSSSIVAFMVFVMALVLYCRDDYHIVVQNNDIETQTFNLSKFAVGLNIFTFAYGSTIVFPEYWSELTDRKQWNGSVISGMGICSILYLPVAIVGYLVYGSFLNSPGISNILDAIKAFTDFKFIVYIANALVVVHLIFAVPIFLTGIFMFIETKVNRWNRKKEYSKLDISDVDPTKVPFYQRIIIRASCMALFIVIALSLPYFTSLMSVFSAFTLSLPCYILPPLFHWIICPHQMNWWRYILHTQCMIFGVVGLVIGIWKGVEGLLDDVHQHPSPFKGIFTFGHT